ncbi:hypothetical protein ADU59_19095 [Pararhizobium polonicum]|uniref:Uncharacterized protein n=1 Tax=Pararhizobium polonicum TaxID=1612624 RepID=A0A1C7NXV7_9HYPH|nr:hypothetical protein ADU59_19095 [Pararhizobium polonicum]
MVSLRRLSRLRTCLCGTEDRPRGRLQRNRSRGQKPPNGALARAIFPLPKKALASAPSDPCPSRQDGHQPRQTAGRKAARRRARARRPAHPQPQERSCRTPPRNRPRPSSARTTPCGATRSK